VSTTGAVLGSVFLPVFGGIFGFGMGAATSQKIKENVNKKIESNLRRIS
jgi:hypothetical protein